MNKKPIYSINTNELKYFLIENNIPKYRINQIMHWLFLKDINNFNEMMNLPKNVIYLLDKTFCFLKPKIIKRITSIDHTTKFLIEFKHPTKNLHTETVLMQNTKRQSTICVSSQSGCNMKCSFCATGKMGLNGNLSAFEIIYQISMIANLCNTKITNVVFMGQGEPFANYDNLLQALDYLNNPHGMNIGARKICVSTCGLPNKIIEFAYIDKQYRLAISLHSGIQNSRNLLMPGLKNIPITKLHSSLQKYCSITKRRVTLEYILFKNINDSHEHLLALINFCNNIKAHVNLLFYNPTSTTNLFSPNTLVYKHWINILSENSIDVSIRKSKGTDINAACGQLALKESHVSRETSV